MSLGRLVGSWTFLVYAFFGDPQISFVLYRSGCNTDILLKYPWTTVIGYAGARMRVLGFSLAYFGKSIYVSMCALAYVQQIMSVVTDPTCRSISLLSWNKTSRRRYINRYARMDISHGYGPGIAWTDEYSSKTNAIPSLPPRTHLSRITISHFAFGVQLMPQASHVVTPAARI